MPQHACTKCGTPSDQPQCPRHRRDPNASWSPHRDRQAQQRFHDAVLERDGRQCTWVEPDTGERCTTTTDLRACHIRPLRDFEPDDPRAYDTSNGKTRCATHDTQTDRYARRRRRQKAGRSKPSPVSSALRIR